MAAHDDTAFPLTTSERREVARSLPAIRRMVTACALCAVIATSATALAQPGETIVTVTTDESSTESFEREEKSPTTALGLAFAGTLASGGALVAAGLSGSSKLGVAGGIGLLLAPGLGHFYTRSWKPVLAGIGLRALGGGAMYYGVISLVIKDRDCSGCIGDGKLLFGGGAALIIGSALYSVIDAPRSARRFNERAGGVTVIPAPIAGPGGSTGFGVQLGWTPR